MKDERSSPRTFYVCKGTEGSSGTAARLLHIIALGGFVDLRLRKKKKNKKQPDMNRKNSDWQPRYKSTMKRLNSKIETRIKGTKANRFQGDHFSALLRRKKKPTTVMEAPKYAHYS